MPGRAFDLIEIPDSFWQRAEVVSALRSRQMGQFFELLHQCTKASQTQIGIACGLNQGKVSEIMRGLTQVEKLEVFERIADGLAMPDSARALLGLAPLATPHPVIPARRAISSKDTRSAVLTVPAQAEEDTVAAAAWRAGHRLESLPTRPADRAARGTASQAPLHRIPLLRAARRQRVCIRGAHVRSKRPSRRR